MSAIPGANHKQEPPHCDLSLIDPTSPRVKRVAITSAILLATVLVGTFLMADAREQQETALRAKGLLRLPIPDRLVVLTFDDAVSSHATFVAPLLKKYGFGGTFFICEFPPDFDTDKKKYMTWQQIRSLNEMGFEVANHTRTHASVNKMSREQLVRELDYIESRCRELGISRPTSFAYPGYETHPDVPKTLAERGYYFAREGGSRTYRPLEDNPLLIPSFSTTGTDENRVLNTLKLAQHGEIVVLTVHGVPDYAHPHVTTPPESFEKYLKYLQDNRYTVIALRDLARFIDPVGVYQAQSSTANPDHR